MLTNKQLLLLLPCLRGSLKPFRSQNCPSCPDHLHSHKRRAAFVPVAVPKRTFYSAAPSQWPSCDKRGLMDETEGMKKACCWLHCSTLWPFSNPRRDKMWRNYRDVRYNSWTLQCNNLMPHSGAWFLFPTESEMCVPACEQDLKETLMQHPVGLLLPCCCLAGLSGEFLKSGTTCTLRL